MFVLSHSFYLLLLYLKLVISIFQRSSKKKNHYYHYITITCLFLGGSVSLHPVLTGPDMAYLGSRVAFRCIAPNASLPVTYELIGDGGVLMRTGTDQGDQHASFFLKVTASSEGSYHCKATIGGSTGVSNIIKLTVVSEYQTPVILQA